MSKRTLKSRFFSKWLKIKQNSAKIEADFLMNFDFWLGWTFFQSKKTSFQVSAVPKLTLFLSLYSMLALVPGWTEQLGRFISYVAWIGCCVFATRLTDLFALSDRKATPIQSSNFEPSIYIILMYWACVNLVPPQKRRNVAFLVPSATQQEGSVSR